MPNLTTADGSIRDLPPVTETTSHMGFLPDQECWLLVRTYSDGGITAATRSDHFATWGPEVALGDPTPPIEEPTSE